MIGADYSPPQSWARTSMIASPARTSRGGGRPTMQLFAAYGVALSDWTSAINLTTSLSAITIAGLPYDSAWDTATYGSYLQYMALFGGSIINGVWILYDPIVTPPMAYGQWIPDGYYLSDYVTTSNWDADEAGSGVSYDAVYWVGATFRPQTTAGGPWIWAQACIGSQQFYNLFEKVLLTGPCWGTLVQYPATTFNGIFTPPASVPTQAFMGDPLVGGMALDGHNGLSAPLPGGIRTPIFLEAGQTLVISPMANGATNTPTYDSTPGVPYPAAPSFCAFRFNKLPSDFAGLTSDAYGATSDNTGLTSD